MPGALNWRRSLGGGETQPQIFECDDDQEWVIKLPGNPHGTSGLCADWIGTALACMVGVAVIECSLIEVTALSLSTLPQGAPARAWAKPGLAFGSRYTKDSEDVDSSAAPLEYFSASQRAALVASDTWLDVLDRRKPDLQWNLLLVKEAGARKLVAIDYGRALTDVIGPPTLGGPLAMQPRIPQGWDAHMTRNDIETAVTLVQALSRADIGEVVESVPTAWRADLRGFNGLLDYVDARRAELTTCLTTGGGDGR